MRTPEAAVPVGVFALLLALAACAPPPPLAVPTAPSAEAPAPPASSAPASVQAVPPPGAVSTFRKVGTLDGIYRVFGRAPGSAYLAAGMDIVGELSGHDVTARVDLHQTDDFVFRIQSQLIAVSKGGGDNVWGAWIFPEGRMGATWIERFDGKKWTGKGVRTRNAHTISQLFDLGGGKIVAIEEPQMGPYGGAFSIVAVEGPKTSLPRVSKRQGKLPAGIQPGCVPAFMPVGVFARKDGGTFVIGNPCELAPDEVLRAMGESFDAKGKSLGTAELALGVTDPAASSHVAVTPLPGGGAIVLATESKDKAETRRTFLLGESAGVPTLVPVKGLPGDTGAFAPDGKGAVYALLPKTSAGLLTLWRIAPSGDAKEMVLPAEVSGGTFEESAVVAAGEEDVWVLLMGQGVTQVYRNTINAPAVSAALGDPQTEIMERLGKKAEAREMKLARRYSSRCETPFVLLYTLAKTAPADYDFPATRDALKGHRELTPAKFLEFSRGGQRFFGAAVPSGDMGKKLVDAVKGKVPGATPQLVCDAPTAERTLDIDLVTGKIRK